MLAVFYLSVTCWEDLYAFADHMEKDYAREFRDTCRDHNIVWRM